MRSLESKSQAFACEVCGEAVAVLTTMGMESDSRFTTPIKLCQQCGAIDLDLMQLCREATIGCAEN
jgi:hypothetical protein